MVSNASRYTKKIVCEQPKRIEYYSTYVPKDSLLSDMRRLVGVLRTPNEGANEATRLTAKAATTTTLNIMVDDE